MNNYEIYKNIKTIQDFKDFIKDKTVSVVGIGVSNIPLLKFLQKCGVKKITARDKKNEKDILSNINPGFAELKKAVETIDINYIFGEKYLDNLGKDEEVIFKTPGVRRDLPEFVQAEKMYGNIITSEMELFFMLCPAVTIAITGSEGKTTTTTIIGEILKAAGKKVYVGGNIGAPVLGEIENITAGDYIVTELSSFQLFDLNNNNFAPDYAVITNITPNHLDWHKDMTEYADAKKIIFKNQKQNNRIILSYDNDITKNLINDVKSTAYLFSMDYLPDEYKNGIYLDNSNNSGGSIIVRENGKETKIIDRSDIFIRGLHNVKNFMAAIGVTYDIVGADTIKTVANTFKGVEHRIEFVRETNSISYYNSTIDSTPTRTISALNYFDRPGEDKKIIVILGGYDKKIAFEPLAPVVYKKVKAAVLYGETKEKIKKALDIYRKNHTDCEELDIFVADNFDNAVIMAKEQAKNGDIVLLSPACASFGSFRNFEERGNRFKELVNNF